MYLVLLLCRSSLAKKSIKTWTRRCGRVNDNNHNNNNNRLKRRGGRRNKTNGKTDRGYDVLQDRFTRSSRFRVGARDRLLLKTGSSERRCLLHSGFTFGTHKSRSGEFVRIIVRRVQVRPPLGPTTRQWPGRGAVKCPYAPRKLSNPASMLKRSSLTCFARRRKSCVHFWKSNSERFIRGVLRIIVC